MSKDSSPTTSPWLKFGKEHMLSKNFLEFDRKDFSRRDSIILDEFTEN